MHWCAAHFAAYYVVGPSVMWHWNFKVVGVTDRGADTPTYGSVISHDFPTQYTSTQNSIDSFRVFPNFTKSSSGDQTTTKPLLSVPSHSLLRSWNSLRNFQEGCSIPGSPVTCSCTFARRSNFKLSMSESRFVTTKQRDMKSCSIFQKIVPERKAANISEIMLHV